MDWSDVPIWFVTSVLGAGLVKLFDLAVNRHQERYKRKAEKVQKIQNYVKQLGELLQYYAFFGELSTVNEKNDGEEKATQISRFLEPEPRFEDAIMSLEKADLKSVIAQKIASIRIASAEVHDLADQLEPDGALKKELANLYFATTGVERALNLKDEKHPYHSWEVFSRSLTSANSLRKQIQGILEKHLD